MRATSSQSAASSSWFARPAETARTNASSGSRSASGHESAASQRRMFALRAFTDIGWTWLATRREAMGTSCAAIAWSVAASTSPASSSHSAARACSTGTSVGRVLVSSTRSASVNSW